MKELSIEEKAKAYDNALEKASKLRVQNPFDNVSQMMEYVFPNLKEDEDKDEKIRKELIDYLIWLRNFREGDYAPSGKYDINNMIAWLENQKEFVSANFEDVWETADCEKLTVPLEKYEMEAIKKLCHAWYDKGIELERKKGFETQVGYALKSFKHEDVCKFKEYIEKQAKAYELNLPVHRGYDIYAFAKELLVWLEKQGNTDIEQVFRPLAGCDIDTAAKQAVEQQKQGKNVVLAFNGCYIPVENNTADAIVEEYHDWLEKQCDKASYESAEKEKQEFVDAGFIKCYADFQDFKEGKTYWLEYLGNDNYNVRSDNLLGKTYHITPCQLYTIFKKQPWSEMQDEPTPNPYSGVGFNDNGNVWGMCARDNGVDILFNKKLIQHISAETQGEEKQGVKIVPKFKVKYNGNEYNVVDIRSSVGIIYYGIEDEPNHIDYVQAQNCEAVDDYVIKENGSPYPTKPAVFSGQKPAVEVESKFQEGDWVVQDHTILKIKSVRSPHYCFETVGGYVDNMLISEIDSLFHLWSVEDANDGDVLAFDDDTIVIFKNLYNKTSFHSYCHLEEGIFDASKDDNPDWWNAEGFYPATKEQRNLLFQKMKEAGYEWDAVNNKVNKIEMQELVEQKPNCSEEALQYLREHHSPSEISDFQAAMNIAVAKAYDKGRADAINAMKKEWSEEDEGCYNSIIEHLKYSITNGKPETYKSGRLTDWLKSLKNRVKSQATQ